MRGRLSPSRLCKAIVARCVRADGEDVLRVGLLRVLQELGVFRDQLLDWGRLLNSFNEQ